MALFHYITFQFHESLFIKHLPIRLTLSPLVFLEVLQAPQTLFHYLSPLSEPPFVRQTPQSSMGGEVSVAIAICHLY